MTLSLFKNELKISTGQQVLHIQMRGKNLPFHFIFIVRLPIDSSGKLYIYHANKESKKIYFYYESKQNDRGTNVWDIKPCKELLDKDICNNILFLHAILL